MIKKTHLIAAIIAIGAVVSGYMLLSPATEPTGEATASKTNSNTQAASPVARPSSVPPAAKPATIAKTPSSSKTVSVERRGPPSKRIFVRAKAPEPKIAPAAEYRKWSTQQWAGKVNSLRAQGDNALAQQYVDAYRQTYPDKRLDPYLK